MPATKVGQDLDFALGARIRNYPAPTNGDEPANKTYVDAAVAGLEWKPPVVVATGTQVTVANPGTATFDGVTLVAGQRLLLTGQSTASQNGPWVFNGSAVALTRPADYAAGSVQQNGAVYVEGGTSAGQSYVIAGTAAVTVDTTATTWNKFAQITPITAGTGVTVTGGVVALATLNGKATGTITGDGTTTSFTLTHTLGTTDVVIEVHDSSGNRVLTGAQATNSTTVTVSFAVAPASAVTYRVIVIG